MTSVRFLRLALLVVPFGAAMILAHPASAMPASCQADFAKHHGDRNKVMERIETFNKKRPTPTQACNAFSSLATIEAKFIEWMNANKEWCQVPEQFIEQLGEANEQSKKIRGQACNAARQEARIRAQQQRGAGAPPPGGGVRLPQGAL